MACILEHAITLICGYPSVQEEFAQPYVVNNIFYFVC